MDLGIRLRNRADQPPRASQREVLARLGREPSPRSAPGACFREFLVGAWLMDSSSHLIRSPAFRPLPPGSGVRRFPLTQLQCFGR